MNPPTPSCAVLVRRYAVARGPLSGVENAGSACEARANSRRPPSTGTRGRRKIRASTQSWSRLAA
eukprot:7535631-Lingulodinium_polyedra.AAC.1